MSRIKILLLFACAIAVFGLLAVHVAGAAPPTIPAGCGSLSPFTANIITMEQPWYCPINQYLYSQWVGEVPLVLVAVALSFVIAGMIFMIGAALSSQRIRNFGIGEFYESIATGLIVALFMYLCAVMFGYVPGLFIGPINPYATAFHLISSTEATAQTLYTQIFNSYATDSFFTSIIPHVQVGEITGVGSILNSAVNLILSSVTSLYKPYITYYYLAPAVAVSNLLVDGMLALWAEYYLLLFFSVAAIPAFLIPGIVLRAVFPTRALGSVLLALAIAFYLVVPLMFAVAYYFTSPLLISNMQAYINEFARWGAGSGAEANALSSTSPLVLTLAKVKFGISGFWLLMLFYPVAIMATAYVFVVEISNLFGGIAPAVSGRIRGFI